MSRSGRLAVVIVVLFVSACGGSDAAETTTQPSQESAPAGATTTLPAAPTTVAEGTGCADVIDAKVESASGGFTVSATVSSADTGWDKYADAWQVRTEDGELLGERILTHPHENEQPFTRSLSGVEIPPTVTQVVVAARDSVVGFCGAEFVAEVVHP